MRQIGPPTTARTPNRGLGEAIMTKTIAPAESGYRPCACRDCFEIAIGEPGAYCHECVDSGCPGYQGEAGMSQECQAPSAYGGSEEDGDCDGDEPGSRIGELCQTDGAYPIASLADGPAMVVARLLEVLRELAPDALALPAVPREALADAAHPAWDGIAEELLRALMAAVNQHAPEGFLLQFEGESLGFYPLANAGL